jgi:sortase A
VYLGRASLLKVGLILSALAIALVIAAAVASVTLRGDEPGWASAAEGAGKALGEALGYSSFGEEEGSANSSSANKHSSGENEPPRYSSGDESLGYGSSSGSGGPVGQRTDEAKGSETAGAASEQHDPSNSQSEMPQAAGQQTPSGPGSQAQQNQTQPEDQLLPGEGSDWARPTDNEIEAANDPRHFGLVPGAIMSLTIQKIGIYNAPVFDSQSPWALANGIAHVPDTSLPWSDTPQRNVYLAGHRMGFRGTWSRMLFYNLDDLGEGDKVVLKDRSGHVYEYKVSEVFLADPTDSWVMGQVKGRDMVSLQTCTPLYTFEKRLIVRADRV